MVSSNSRCAADALVQRQIASGTVLPCVTAIRCTCSRVCGRHSQDAIQCAQQRDWQASQGGPRTAVVCRMPQSDQQLLQSAISMLNHTPVAHQ